MKLFKTRTAKLKERIISLEDHLGLAYAEKDGYYEHLNEEYGTIPRLVKAVDEIQKKGKK